jgi:hypothetical protein
VSPNEEILIEYEEGELGTVFKKLKRSDLPRQLIEIALAGGDTSKIRFWRQTKAQAKLDVVIEGI